MYEIGKQLRGAVLMGTKGKKTVYQNHHVDYEKDYTVPLKKSHHFCISRYFQTLKQGEINARDVVNFLIACLFELRRILPTKPAGGNDK